MEDEEVNNVLISWKGPENNVFLMCYGKILPVIDGYAVVWTGTGTFFFQFLVNGQTVTADHYPKKQKNGVVFNSIEVEPIPEEFTQIKFLTLKEIEIIDQEVFGPKGCGGKVEKIRDYFQEAAEKIVSLLKMNVLKNKFEKVLRSVKIIQRWIRRCLMKNKGRAMRESFGMRKNFPLILRAKKCVKGKHGKSKTLGRVVMSFQELKEVVKKKPKVYQVNLRVSKK